ncbi:MAG: hypothetical protein DID92_2727744083 [Candidatus Nitrotoga sp. SPKER]|nr:MAG: hypothetical protein DID92_2727744083 [Candidatus Nitrotoga sp. SPKER]
MDALEQALHDRQPDKSAGLIHHSNRGSQYVSIKYTERLGEWVSALLLAVPGMRMTTY